MTPFHKTPRATQKQRASGVSPEDAKRRVVGYVRVSSQEQADSGVSLDAQREKITSYCSALGLELVSVQVDAGVSGGSLARPGLQQALAALQAGAARGLLVAKLDRLTRSVRDLGQLLDTYFASDKHDLLSVADSIDTRTAAGRLMLNVLTSVAAWEREAGGERTATALHKLRASRRVYGEVPMGMKATGKRDADGRRLLAVDPAGAATVARARALRSEGYSLRQVAALLDEEGRKTKKGGTWGAETVRSMLFAAEKRGS
jgi:DNA invertase Pin-like site-specific DNA recombinase